MSKLYLLFFFVILAGCATDSIDSTSKRLQAMVPEDWQVERESNYLIISKKDKVLFYDGASLDQGEKGQLAIGLRFDDKLTMEQGRQELDEHQKEKQEIAKAGNDEQKKFEWQNKEVPKYYTKDYSVYISEWFYGRGFEYNQVWPKEAWEQYNNIRRQLQDVFGRY